jgi:2-polyprenyl-6-methoxyphenol hydroxylase-like FAD-dependent oxidoreductase
MFLSIKRRGVKCLVLESSPEMRASGFALGIWTNAWRALDALGVGNKVREHHILGER